MPFFNFSNSLQIQANGVNVPAATTLNFVNGVVAQSSGIVSFTAPSVTVTDGVTAIDSPYEIILSGAGQALTKGAPEVSVLQNSVNIGSSVTFPSNVTSGNLLLTFSGNKNSNANPSIVGFSAIDAGNNGYLRLFGKQAIATDGNTFSYSGQVGDNSLCNLEIENGQALADVVVSFPTETVASGVLTVADILIPAYGMLIISVGLTSYDQTVPLSISTTNTTEINTETSTNKSSFLFVSYYLNNTNAAVNFAPVFNVPSGYTGRAGSIIAVVVPQSTSLPATANINIP